MKQTLVDIHLYGKCLVLLILFWGRSQPKQCPKVLPSPVQRGSELSLRFLTSHFNTAKQVWNVCQTGPMSQPTSCWM